MKLMFVVTTFIESVFIKYVNVVLIVLKILQKKYVCVCVHMRACLMNYRGCSLCENVLRKAHDQFTSGHN